MVDMKNPIMQYFKYKHLPARQQEVSGLVCRLAEMVNEELPECPEKSAGLRKLLEANDCLVRASLEK